MDQASVEDSLRRLAEGHVLVLAPGTPYIWMANPLSALPTPFVAVTGRRSWFGNCIWDALGIVAMFGGTGTVSTWCPDCHERLAVSVEDNSLSSGEGVVHFAVPADISRRSRRWSRGSELTFTRCRALALFVAVQSTGVGLSGCYSNRLREFRGLIVDLQREAERPVQLDDLVRVQEPNR
ncbi:MAG: hypothetical protein GEU78_15540 [Actinobacteria bacterium]|nr:hypothetical protein [Actinomycetota bacterium]